MLLDIYEASQRYRLPNVAFGLGTSDGPVYGFRNEAGLNEPVPAFLDADYTNPRTPSISACPGWLGPEPEGAQAAKVPAQRVPLAVQLGYTKHTALVGAPMQTALLIPHAASFRCAVYGKDGMIRSTTVTVKYLNAIYLQFTIYERNLFAVLHRRT